MSTKHNSKTMREILGRDSVHPFPARMAPGLILDVMKTHRKPMRVLDPMSGSGTVVAVARANGHRAIGIDIDPLAVLISKVWITTIDPAMLLEEASDALVRARQTFGTLRERHAYPENADDETKQFAKFWFDDSARRQLASLASSIGNTKDEKIRNALWCAFSRLIITKKSGASLAMDLSHSRPHKVFDRAPTEPFSKFLHAVKRVANNCIRAGCGNAGPTARVYKGDARNLPIGSDSIDLVFTSPPYLNAIDYIRCSKFSLIWMGYSTGSMRHIRHVAVGSDTSADVNDGYAESIISRINLQPRMTTRNKSVLIRYINDMRHAIDEVARVLTDNGQAVYVIGENTMHKTFIPNSRIMEMLANDAGLRRVSKRTRKLPANRRYLPPPPSSKFTTLNGRLRHEVILTLKRAV